jgi:hypothetical protein
LANSVSGSTQVLGQTTIGTTRGSSISPRPGGPASTTWSYLNGTQTVPAAGIASGTLNFTANLAEKQEWFAAFFTSDGYTEIAPRVPFYVGTVPALSAGKTVYDEGETVVITYANAPAGAKDWIALYSTGQTPGETASAQWQYVSGASGSLSFAALPKGFYYAVYLVNDGYFSDRLAFSVGSRPADLSIVGPSTFSYGTQFATSFTGGAGTPKDYIGIFVRGATPGVDRLVTYLYVGGATKGGVTFIDRLPAGEYYLALFINDSYTEISNRVEFTVMGGPTMPEIEGVRHGTGNQLIIGVKVQPGASHRLQYCTELNSSWTTIQTFTGEGLRMDLSVPFDVTSQPKGFWRVVRP